MKTPLDEHERVDQLSAVDLRSAAIVGERRQRAERGIAAQTGAEIGLEAPDRHEDRPRHAITLFDSLQRFGVRKHHRLPPFYSGRRDVARGEGGGIRAEILAAIVRRDRRIKHDAAQGRIDHLLGNAVAQRDLLERVEPFAESARAVSAICGARGRDAERPSRRDQNACRLQSP